MDGNTRRERGSVVPLMALAVVLVGVVALAIGRIGQAAVWRARAQAGADAAALAGAVEGRRAAEALARQNGAELVAFELEGRSARVTVRVGGAEAGARATSSWDRRSPPAGMPSTARNGTTRSEGKPPIGARHS